MPQGYLKVILQLADGAFPISGENVYVSTKGNSSEASRTNYRLITDSSGATSPISIETPDVSVSLNEFNPDIPYATADVYTEIPGYFPVRIKGVQIFPGRLSTLPVNLTPLNSDFTESSSGVIEYVIPENALLTETVRKMEYDDTAGFPQIASSVAIPEFITVHLGAPNENTKNVRVSFPDYVKNVASSEIEP